MSESKLNATLFHQAAHLPEEDLLPPTDSCPFCASAARTFLLELQKDPVVTLLYCNSCHASSASRMPTPAALDKYYSHYYDDKEEKVTLDVPDRMSSHITSHVMPHLGDLVGREISILDFGGGDGSISVRVAQRLHDLGARKINIALVDYSPSTVRGTHSHIQISRPAELAQIADESIDLVIASAIIEHIPQPKEAMTKLFFSLKSGGVLYARTPYVAPLSKIAERISRKFDFTYPAHVHDLGAKFWNKALDILPLNGEYQLLRSTPSIVETSFRQNFSRTLIAHMLKIPGYILKESYGLVGGWEVFIRRKSNGKASIV